MTTRNGRAATPCEVSEPPGTEAPPAPRLQGSGQLQPEGDLGEGSAPSEGEEVGRAQLPTSRLQVGYK